MLKVMRESSMKEIEDIPIRCMSIAMDETDLASAISKRKVDILYITPVRAVGIDYITAISRAKKIVTLTGVPEYVEAGIAVGIGIKGEKPQIIINLPAAKAEGANFSSELLNLAKIIK
jgi:DNA topoisomerase VI subunit B